MYIDTHAHYDIKAFNADRDGLLRQIFDAGVECVINPAISYESNFDMREKLQNYDGVYYAVGIHPGRVGLDGDLDVLWEKNLRKLAAGKDRVVAVGETGLDFHHLEKNQDGELTGESALRLERQYQWFRRQIDLAIGVGLPLILHVREAHWEAIQILREYREKLPDADVGVVHCFNGGVEEALEYVRLGYFLGIGGKVTEPENAALREAVGEVSLASIVLETDAPYVMPYGLEGKRNTSLNIPLIAEELARLKGVELSEVGRITTENARRLFRIQ